MHHQRKRILLACLLALGSTQAFSAGFGLSEQSGSGLGNAFAGAAASAEDASTIYFNPAGMTYIEGTQLVGAVHLIKPSGEFHNTAGTASGGDIGDLAALPNLYYKRDLTDKVKFGLGVNSPFGLKTEYDLGWAGATKAIKSDLKTININPSIAFKLNDNWSLGIGVSAMWAKAELSQQAGLAVTSPLVTVKGDDWGFGVNFGAIYQATESTRLGLAYRSPVKQHLQGDVSSSIAIPALNTKITADATMPETVSLSLFSNLNDSWDLLADITHTGWSQFNELRIKYAANGTTFTVTPEHWHDTTRFSIGTNYKYSDTLKLRAGLAYDEEAIDDQYRTARIPGNDRTWLALGAAWQFSPSTKLDAGYAHLFIKDAKINDATGVPLRGSYDGHADILSMQVTHNF